MHWLVPFPDFDPPAWREKMQHAGFSPSQAMKVYDEMRLFGHVSLRTDPVSAGDEQWDEIRVRMCAALDAIKTPQDFTHYIENYADLFVGETQPSFEAKNRVDREWMKNGNHDRLERMDLLSRLTRFEDRQPEQWKAWEDLGMEWEDLEASMGHDVLVQPQLATSLDNPMSALEESVKSSGLRGVEWGLVNGDSAVMITHTAKNITDANEILSKRTGWTGGLLGLNGRICFRLGLDLTGNSGTCCPLAVQDDIYHLNSSAKDCWGVVSHEWLHGLDFAMGHKRGQAASEMASEIVKDTSKSKPWKALIKQITGHRFDENAGHLIQSELNDGFKARWSAPNQPEGMADFLDTLRTNAPKVKLTRQERKHQHSQIANFIQNDNPKAGNVSLKAEIALTELDLLRDQSRLIEEGGSIWVQFAKKFQENVQKNHPKLAEEWAGYFLMPCEQAAHSFEATFTDKQCFITDVDAEKSPLRYPLPSEAMAQNLAWRRLFKAAAPWWKSQKPKPSAESHLSAAVPEPLAAAARFEDRVMHSRQTKEAAHPVLADAKMPQM